MQPIIQHYPYRLLAGFSFFGNPFHSNAGWTEENEIGRLWKRLLAFWALPNCPYPLPTISYEVHLQNHETPRTGEFEVFVGFEVQAFNSVPVELCVKILPEADYAIFTLRGEQIRSDEPIIDRWLASAGYQMAFSFFIQRYDQRFKGLDRLDESELDFLIAVRRTNSDDCT